MNEEIIRMKIELEELQEKIKKGKDFLNKEKEKNESEKILDDNQKLNLAYQLMQMDGYARTLEERIKYDTKLEEEKNTIIADDEREFSESDNQLSNIYKYYTSEKYAKEHGFKDWKDFEENGDYHTEKTEDDMKVWFLECFNDLEKIKILEGEKDSQYGNWDYIYDKKIWVYKYL